MSQLCPICSSSNTIKSSNGFSSRTNAGINYLKAIKVELNKDINKKLPLYTCLNCGTGWRGVSIISSKIDQIYHTYHSLHWKSFLIFKEVMKGNREKNHLEGIEEIVENYSNFLSKKIDIIEIGSPILGFGFQYVDINRVKGIKSHSRNVNNLDSLLLFQENLTFLSIKIYRYISNLKKILKTILGRKKVIQKTINKFKKIRFYDIPTTIGWGSSSVICGHSTLKWLLFLNPDIELINRYQKINYLSDLSICVNYLDHFDSPIAIIKEMLLVSNALIFNIHKQSDAALQHKFTYPDNFDNVLSRLLDDKYICAKISEDIINIKNQNKYNFFIVGERKFIEKFLNYLISNSSK